MAKGDRQVFDKMILTVPAGVVQNRGFRYRFKVKAYRFVKKFAPAFAERKFGSKEYRSLSPVMKESYKKIVNEDLRKDASEVDNSVLLVVGKDDTVTPKREAEAYLEAFPNAKLLEISGGHFAFMENAVSFNLAAEEFLNYG
jgi:pimeloyl-ACP methyl ester carboxylesterase